MPSKSAAAPAHLCVCVVQRAAQANEQQMNDALAQNSRLQAELAEARAQFVSAPTQHMSLADGAAASLLHNTHTAVHPWS